MKMERWRDEMNWARQGRREKPKGGKGKRKKGKRTTVLVTCLYSVSSPKTFFLVLLLAFFSRAG